MLQWSVQETLLMASFIHAGSAGAKFAWLPSWVDASMLGSYHQLPRNMVSIHVLGADVVTNPSFVQVRGGALCFQVKLLTNKILYFNNRGANMIFVFAAAILGIYCDVMLIRFIV